MGMEINFYTKPTRFVTTGPATGYQAAGTHVAVLAGEPAYRFVSVAGMQPEQFTQVAAQYFQAVFGNA